MKLVVGLGNPGREYARTRHNVGFEVVDRVAAKTGLAAAGDFDRTARSRFDALAIDGLATLGGAVEKVLLLKPTTFMNLSGRSVQQAVAFYKIEPSDLLVVLDDLALPLGRIRLRGAGTSGGHNGLADIERSLGTRKYPRLRIGIDAPRLASGRDYVLGAFTPEQRAVLDPALDRAADAVLCWMADGLAAAMNRFNPPEDAGATKRTKDETSGTEPR